MQNKFHVDSTGHPTVRCYRRVLSQLLHVFFRLTCATTDICAPSNVYLVSDTLFCAFFYSNHQNNFDYKSIGKLDFRLPHDNDNSENANKLNHTKISLQLLQSDPNRMMNHFVESSKSVCIDNDWSLRWMWSISSFVIHTHVYANEKRCIRFSTKASTLRLHCNEFNYRMKIKWFIRYPIENVLWIKLL